MPTTSPRPTSPTTQALAQRALQAFERLYRLTDADEPDLAFNVTLIEGKCMLQRFTDTSPSAVGVEAGEAALAYLVAAEQANDPRVAEALFPAFVQGFIGLCERRDGLRASHDRRPYRLYVDGRAAPIVPIQDPPRDTSLAMPARQG